MEDGQARGILFEMAPVRVGFGHVAAEDEVIFGRTHECGQVSGEGTLVGGRDQDREGIRVHERDGVGMVVHAEMFGDVHE